MKPIFTFITLLFFYFFSQSLLFGQNFTVTITIPVNGQIEVFNGDAQVTSGETVAGNTELTFVSSPNEGYALQHIAINDNPLQEGEDSYTIIEDITISAVFIEAPPVQNFTVTITPPVNGQIEILNGDIVVNSGDIIPENTVLTINTVPDFGYKLQHVLINGSTLLEGQDTYTVTEDITIDVEFVEATYAELIFTRPMNGKFIIDYIKDGSEVREEISTEATILFDKDSEITIKAVGSLGYSWKNWTEDFTDFIPSSNPLTFTFNDQATLGAVFSKSPILTIPKPSNGQIEITYSEQGEQQNKVFQGNDMEVNMELKVDIGTIVELRATADADFDFAGWEGDLSSVEDYLTFTIPETDISIQAIFMPSGAEIQVLLDRILAVTNKNNSETLKNARYTWYKDNKLISNGSSQYIEVGSPIPSGNYSVTILFPNTTEVILERSFISTLSIFPNPVSKNQPLTILSGNPEGLKCEVYSITGNQINAQVVPSESGFIISGIPIQGTYVVHLKGEDNTEVVKFVVK